MKNRNHYKKMLSFSVVVICMIFAVLSYVKDAEAAETSIQYVSGYTYSQATYVVDDTRIAPEAPDGYLFAGWYTTEDETTYTAVTETVEGAIYYAKFVPKEVLEVKAQVTMALVADEAASGGVDSAIRLVTTVDSDQYQQVGFHIVRPDKEYDTETTNVVYETLYAINATKSNPGEPDTTYTPSCFHETASKYFKTWTIRKVPAQYYDSDLTITAYWITPDGTRVDGTSAVKTVNLGRSWIHVDSTYDGEERGTASKPYSSIQAAVTHDTGSSTVYSRIILDGNIEVSEAIEVTKTVTITSNSNITITESVTDSGNLFTVPEGKTLTIKAADGKFITIDGNDTEAEEGSLITVAAGGQLNMKNVEMKNAYNSAAGGAVYNEGTLTLEGGCKFTSNQATCGAAIYNNGMLDDTSSVYTSNIGGTTSGGAVRNYNEAKATFSGSQFINNSTEAYGGAMYSAGATHEMSDCTFSGNSSSGTRGGALYINLHYGEFKATNCVFEQNKVTGTTEGGGAIYFTDGENIATLENTTTASFTKNTAGANAGAIYNNGVELYIKGYTFTNNSAANGGTIYNVDGKIYDTGCVYTSNSASGHTGVLLNGATAASSSYFAKSGGSFSSNTAGTNSGAVRNYGTIVMSDVSFESNGAATNGGAIRNESGKECSMTNVTFTSNHTDSTTGDGGGAIYNNSGTITLVNGCEFSLNTGYYGGAIWNKGTLNSNGSEFKTNTASYQGGAIYNAGSITDNGSTYAGNSSDGGGAIYNYASGTITLVSGCEFNTNTASSQGGAIYNAGSITDSGSTYDGNVVTAAKSGTAIRNEGTSASFTGCTFKNHTANNTHAGAIYSSKAMTVDTCTFEKNSAKRGGAIYCNSSVAVEIKNCGFMNNSATQYGGAILIQQGSVAGCTFSGNSADVGGDDLWINNNTASKVTYSDNTYSGEEADCVGSGYKS